MTRRLTNSHSMRQRGLLPHNKVSEAVRLANELSVARHEIDRLRLALADAGATEAMLRTELDKAMRGMSKGAA